MEYTKILFYIFAFLAIMTSLFAVFVRNIAHSVLFLVCSFLLFAGLWILVQAEFLAIILILVYVGAVMVLFLFVVKMLDINESAVRAKFTAYLPFGIFIALLVIAEMFIIFSGSFNIDAPAQAEGYNNIVDLATTLYTKYVFQFELAAVILLVAIVAAISLVHTKTKNRKVQNIGKQINTKAEDRIRIIKDNK